MSVNARQAPIKYERNPFPQYDRFYYQRTRNTGSDGWFRIYNIDLQKDPGSKKERDRRFNRLLLDGYVYAGIDDGEQAAYFLHSYAAIKGSGGLVQNLKLTPVYEDKANEPQRIFEFSFFTKQNGDDYNVQLWVHITGSYTQMTLQPVLFDHLHSVDSSYYPGSNEWYPRFMQMNTTLDVLKNNQAYTTETLKALLTGYSEQNTVMQMVSYNPPFWYNNNNATFNLPYNCHTIVASNSVATNLQKITPDGWSCPQGYKLTIYGWNATTTLISSCTMSDDSSKDWQLALQGNDHKLIGDEALELININNKWVKVG
ncbi:hypothetical protein ACA614_13430 [Lactiplantibacillus plantarum]|uniref:hypothetical protein n=1 Tax=Lactiplantibacillus plantarum TaxID=1590 RepID=UPI003C25A59C